MPLSPEELETLVNKVYQLLDTPFWKKGDFWIFIGIGSASVFASYKAFREARKARTAAHEAGRTVKIQTITIELSELVQKLDTLDIEIDFSTARDFLNEINRRIRRLMSPFQTDDMYIEVITNIKAVLSNAKGGLDEVKPINADGQEPVSNSIYYAIESYFSELSGYIAELMGLFEKRTIETGGEA